MRRLTYLFLLMFTALSLFTFQGCDKKDGDGTEDPNNPPASTTAGSVLGTVQSTYGSGLDGVTVTVGTQSTTTNDQGWFSISPISAGTRVQVKYSLNGYVSTEKIVNVVVGQTTFVEATLASIGVTTTVGTTGGTVTANGGATITFGPNAFNNGGAATVNATYFDPTTSYFAEAFPGEFSGVSAGGVTGSLESFGFIDVDLLSSTGQTLNLASGQTATLTIPIPYALQATAPATIPLWYYDESSGTWREQGTATKVGNTYTGTVTHFTSWNWDRIYDVAYISGRVVDGDGNPVNHAFVTADGVDYSGQSYRYTGSDGTFRMGVKPSSTVIVKAAKGGVTSSPRTISPTPANGQESNIGDIVLAAPYATITLTWGQAPSDLDSHLLVPPSTTGGSYGHVYYSSKGSMSSYPYAELDTDDQSSYGPENVTIVRKYQGTYKYFVHNWSGESSHPLTGSGAKITLILNGNLYSFNVPTTGNSASANSWHVFDLVVNSSGSISLQSINTFEDREAILTSVGTRLMKQNDTK